jgi:hypothetical protein
MHHGLGAMRVSWTAFGLFIGAGRGHAAHTHTGTSRYCARTKAHAES